ncbi:hypothetical protein CYMTET_5607 [Cymbomonas tetramitiformis]|uniref:Uncharacterized protein n=1 Tax=Cymbomonas tetramitiformis TaxID=36881 RepID=A0AAE0LIW7_9CHLO|nr:hypothetical protein CYMTET_5607 [Cymbomonas tetramitiformis]
MAGSKYPMPAPSSGKYPSTPQGAADSLRAQTVASSKQPVEASSTGSKRAREGDASPSEQRASKGLKKDVAKLVNRGALLTDLEVTVPGRMETRSASSPSSCADPAGPRHEPSSAAHGGIGWSSAADRGKAAGQGQASGVAAVAKSPTKRGVAMSAAVSVGRTAPKAPHERDPAKEAAVVVSASLVKRDAAAANAEKSAASQVHPLINHGFLAIRVHCQALVVHCVGEEG